MFKTRLLSGIVLVLGALLTIMAGGVVLWITLLCISVIGMQEFYRVMKIEEQNFGQLEVMGYIGAVLIYIALLFQASEFAMVALLFALVVFMSGYVFTYPKYTIQQVMTALFGIVYVAVMLSYIYQTRCLPDGKLVVWLIFLSSWGSDTCAYCVGMLIGKHKMAPVLSPKKSVEGAVGGVVGAVLLGCLYALLLKQPILIYGILCGVGALISMVGDLAASAVKRSQDVKDYGHLIPGHGGILDRFDSVIFISPFIYFLAAVFL
ncbi:MAG: phosphatidate cytidylyltransferase [Lachnospiraceae bacterium]|jgi:phosphatidate cytidylyltransferase